MFSNSLTRAFFVVQFLRFNPAVFRNSFIRIPLSHSLVNPFFQTFLKFLKKRLAHAAPANESFLNVPLPTPLVNPFFEVFRRKKRKASRPFASYYNCCVFRSYSAVASGDGTLYTRPASSWSRRYRPLPSLPMMSNFFKLVAALSSSSTCSSTNHMK